MRRHRLVPSLVLVVALSATAHAAPRGACELVRDARGDSGLIGGEGGGGPVPGTYDASLDVVSADVATDARNLTAVIRVATLGFAENPTPYGGMWSFHFATPEAAFFLSAYRTYAGDRFVANVYTSEYSGDTSQSFIYRELATVSGAIDSSRNEVRITAPLSLFAPHDRIVRGTPIRKLLAISWFAQEAVGEHPTSSQADEGSSTAVYRAGARSCVAVGR